MLNRKALVGTRGIEPPFSPRAALTSKERLASRHTRTRRVFPCNARLSGLPDRENRLLVGCHNRNRRRAACGASFRTSYNPSDYSAMQCPRSIGGAGGIEPPINGRFPTRRVLPQYRPALLPPRGNVRIDAAQLFMLLPPCKTGLSRLFIVSPSDLLNLLYLDPQAVFHLPLF